MTPELRRLALDLVTPEVLGLDLESPELLASTKCSILIANAPPSLDLLRGPQAIRRELFCRLSKAQAAESLDADPCRSSDSGTIDLLRLVRELFCVAGALSSLLLCFRV